MTFTEIIWRENGDFLPYGKIEYWWRFNQQTVEVHSSHDDYPLVRRIWFEKGNPFEMKGAIAEANRLIHDLEEGRTDFKKLGLKRCHDQPSK